MRLSTFDIQVHVEEIMDWPPVTGNDWLEYQEYLDMMEAKDKQAQLEPQG